MITTYIHVHTKQINDRDQEPDKEDEYGLFSLILFVLSVSSCVNFGNFAFQGILLFHLSDQSYFLETV